jgi:hypothetical protein
MLIFGLKLNISGTKTYNFSRCYSMKKKKEVEQG